LLSTLIVHLPQNKKYYGFLSTIFISIFPDTIAKETLNLPSPEKPTTYQQAAAEITKNSAIVVLDAHKQQAKGKTCETVLENKI
jgi:hypothetical protein